ncbi:MAG: GGDEF domain-containing protein [Paracoccus hibiscisoli]|uniref:GGDEF domain-containing protein n=1 Tax=Paracoccus hibiscisoli TaxID=2023261 RepID=UPI00391BF0F9
MSGPVLGASALAQLLPMHLWLARDGAVLSIGPTLAKLLPDMSEGLSARLMPAREQPGSCVLSAIGSAVDQRTRLFLRLTDAPDLVLRGHGVRAEDGSILLNLGFGIGLHKAIQSAGLTDDDFAPSELAMELLFLHEANRGVLTELSRFNDQLAQSREVALLQAQTDTLTGLHNRRGLEIALSLSLRSVDLPDDAPQPFALVHLDLDHFKQVNDQLGHQAGDDLLRSVGGVLRSHVRKADTAARIGGDEFVLILRGMTSRPALQTLSERIIAAINALSPPELVGLSVSASMGVVIWTPGGSARADDVLAQADRALYMSKGSGRGRVTIL